MFYCKTDKVILPSVREKLNLKSIFYSLNYEDIQTVAEQELVARHPCSAGARESSKFSKNPGSQGLRATKKNRATRKRRPFHTNCDVV